MMVNIVLLFKKKSHLRIERLSNRYIAGGVMVIVVGNGHNKTSSNPGRD